MSKLFPIQRTSRDPYPMKIPWEVAELVYSQYAAKYGTDQSLEQLAERGGFWPTEMDMFLPDWRERCSELEKLRIENQRLRETLQNVRRYIWNVHLNTGVRSEPLKELLENMDAVLRGEERSNAQVEPGD